MTLLQRRLTLEEFLDLPERKPALEYEEGAVCQKVSPRGKHSGLQLALCEQINSFARPMRLALALPELRTTFVGRSYVPDVSMYRWGRIPWDATGELPDVFSEAPDLAVEIVSPKQGVTALVRRCLWFVANGVQMALLVDPTDRSVLLFRPAAAPLALRGDDRIELDDLVPGFELTVGQLFASLKYQ